MFRKTGDFSPKKPWKRYFSHVRGPWQKWTNASCAISADINRDGLDDLIVCNQKEGAFIFVQRKNGVFGHSIPTVDKSQRNWRNARVADLTGDGIPDLAVVYHSENSSFLRVFKGIKKPPYFQFRSRSYYNRRLPFAAPDLEVIDADRDGNMDLYIVQADERQRRKDGTFRRNNYCGGRLKPARWWSGGRNRISPPDSFVPPRDIAPDLLLLGQPKTKNRFKVVKMKHQEPGCGYFVKRFNRRSLVLVQGGFVRPGFQLLLEW